MTREIVTEKFAENFDNEYVSHDFPLISAMCAKNDYTGCYILKLVNYPHTKGCELLVLPSQVMLAAGAIW